MEKRKKLRTSEGIEHEEILFQAHDFLGGNRFISFLFSACYVGRVPCVTAGRAIAASHGGGATGATTMGFTLYPSRKTHQVE
ncbi:MAG: hypothetical protein MUF42_17595 [Cytophagaceae bacterium]|nr:hypothetical protein [Cytophagaceae bacterium]